MLADHEYHEKDMLNWYQQPENKSCSERSVQGGRRGKVMEDLSSVWTAIPSHTFCEELEQQEGGKFKADLDLEIESN